MTESTLKVKLTHCCRPLVVGCSIYDSIGVMNGWMWRHIVHLSMFQIQIHTKMLISSGVVSMYCIISCCLLPGWRGGGVTPPWRLEAALLQPISSPAGMTAHCLLSSSKGTDNLPLGTDVMPYHAGPPVCLPSLHNTK